MARARAKAEGEEEGVCGKESSRPSPVAYMGGGGRQVGSGCGRVARCGRAHRKTNRHTSTEDPGSRGETCDVGAKPCSYVKSRVGRGGQRIDCSPEESEATCDVGGQSGGQSNHWKAIGSHQVQLGERSDF